MIYKNLYALIKKLNAFLGDLHKNFICRRCLNSYTNENALINHKQKCGDDNICTIRTSSESQIQCNNQFHRNLVYFRIYADFGADNAIDNSTLGNKTTIIYKQNAVLNGYRIEPKLNDILQSGYYESPLRYNNVEWFVNEFIKLQSKMAVYFKNTKEDIIMTKENEDFICEKYFESDKIRDHFHLTCKCRGPVHGICNKMVTQQQSNNIQFIFHKSNCDYQKFLKRLVDLKNNEVNFKRLPKTNEEFIPIGYGCVRFNNIYRYL